MRLTCSVLLVILFQSCFLPVKAQQLADSSHISAVSSLQKIYLTEIADNAGIYHGREYIRSGQKAIGFPYYYSDDMLTGSVSYQGTVYADQRFFYNLISDEIIISNYAQNALIILSSEKIDSFTIGQHAFINLHAKKEENLNKNGFYEKLSGGEPSLYLRIEKRLETGTGSEEARYKQYNYYFIRIGNVYYPVTSQYDLMAVLKDQKDALKKYIRSNKLNFKKDFENSLLLLTAYYSRLKN